VSTDAPASRQADAPGGPAPGFDLDRPWRLDDRVAVRPEPFGALLYHFGTRLLSFLKDTTLLAVLQALGEHLTARSACIAAGIGDGALPAYQRALAAVARLQMITRRDGPAGFAGFKLSVVVTRHNVTQLDELKALADTHGAQLRLTRLRPSGRGAESWHLLPGPATPIRSPALLLRPARTTTSC
jgi:putative mycofactocin binding protein MftB